MLPSEPSKPATIAVSMLLYGAPKMGKSTFCAGLEKPLFLATEPGLNHLSVFQVPIKTWSDLGNAVRLIEAGKHDFRTIVLDTVDAAYRLCSDAICKSLGVAVEADAPYGKGSQMVQAEMWRVLTRLASLGLGLALTSHSREVEIETRTGKVVRAVPSLPDRVCRIVAGMVDIIAYVSLAKDGARVIHTKPSNSFDAGDRTGRLSSTLELDPKTFQLQLTQKKGIAQ